MNEQPTTVYIGLGSNLDDPYHQIQSAIEYLSKTIGIRGLRTSPCYKSKPHGPQDQPDFINAVATFETRLPPHDLLDTLKAIEYQFKRKKTRHWGPRTLDLDILLYGNTILNTETLTIPHPRMLERHFVLYPLAALTPTLILPDGSTLAAHLKQIESESRDSITLTAYN